jgi:hypothetical protein
MSRSKLFLAALMVAGLLGTSTSFSQITAPTVKQSVEERAMKRKQAAADLKQKQLKLNECKKLAKEQKIRLTERRAFVIECRKK